jgi:hypothetical protein
MKEEVNSCLDFPLMTSIQEGSPLSPPTQVSLCEQLGKFERLCPLSTLLLDALWASLSTVFNAVKVIL